MAGGAVFFIEPFPGRRLPLIRRGDSWSDTRRLAVGPRRNYSRESREAKWVLGVRCTAAILSSRCSLWVKSGVFGVQADVRCYPQSDRSSDHYNYPIGFRKRLWASS